VVAVAMPGGGLCPDPALAQPADVRILTLRVVDEEMYRASPGWEAELRRTVKAVSDIYERGFQIRFRSRGAAPELTLSGVFSYTLVAEPKAPPPPPR
jgi:hypothetical protein